MKRKTAERIADLIERLSRLLRSGENAGELNPAQWESIRFLARANRFSRTPGGLARYLAATKGTVSQTVQALERKGLVRRKSDPEDARVVRLDLSAAGRRYLEQDPLSSLVRQAERLADPEMRAVQNGLESMLGHLLAERDFQAFGQCRTCRFFEPEGSAGQRGGPHRCSLLQVSLSEADSEAICVEHEPAI